MSNPISDQMDSDPELARVTEHAKAVGMLCMYWSLLEYSVNLLIEKLLGSNEATTACVISETRDISGRCEIAKRLTRLKAPNKDWEEWTQALIDLLDVIKGILGPRRNRYVHDDWGIKKGELMQYDRRVKIQKPQSHKAIQLIHVTPRTTKTEDIWELLDHTIKAMVAITVMASTYKALRRTKQIPTIPKPVLELNKMNPKSQTQASKPAP